MTLTLEEREAYLTQVAKRLIREMLDREKPQGEMMLEDIEQAALRVGRELQTAVVAELVANTEQVEEVRCPTCGKGMTCQGKRSRAVVTEAGEITLKRAYYYCRMCRVGSFPPR